VRPLPRILLIDPQDQGRRVLAERLQLQGFVVRECRDGAEGAVFALEQPPSAVIADLAMPSISGVQLCRLLRSEHATSQVPVVLRGAEGRRNRFWAEQAGASAYVVKGHMGELVRALRRAIEREQQLDVENAMVPSSESLDVRDRIASNLDTALFNSVIAAEVRRLGSSESFDRLMDLLSQFVAQVTTYRWMALYREGPRKLGIHTNTSTREASIAEALLALGQNAETPPLCVVEDDDAVADPDGPSAICEPIPFGEHCLGMLAIAPRAPIHKNDPLLVRTIAREIGGALRVATLVEESRHLATTDALTGLLNRRAFLEWAVQEQRRALRYHDAMSAILLDIDHFKHINDSRGHASGDLVLAAVARTLKQSLRNADVLTRWGGEEFVLALPSTPLSAAFEVAERVRASLEKLALTDTHGEPVRVTASLGVASLREGDTIEAIIDRADRTMYLAKSRGRNRVCAEDGATSSGRVLDDGLGSLPDNDAVARLSLPHDHLARSQA
jgi:two-component system cell cycle response regulator